MYYIPQPALSTIFSFLHQPYDYEKKQVMKELQGRCDLIGDDFSYPHLIPSLMIRVTCIYTRLASQYRGRAHQWQPCPCRGNLHD